MAETILAWDSCIVIDAVQQEPERWPTIQPMVNQAEAGELQIVVSTATIAEVQYLRFLSDQGLSQEAQDDLIERWFDNEYIVKRNADRGVCRLAAELARQHAQKGKPVSPIDSIILATAILAEAEVLVTIDSGDSKRVGLLELDGKVGDPGLRIKTPDQYTIQPGLL